MEQIKSVGGGTSAQKTDVGANELNNEANFQDSEQIFAQFYEAKANIQRSPPKRTYSKKTQIPEYFLEQCQSHSPQ